MKLKIKLSEEKGRKCNYTDNDLPLVTAIGEDAFMIFKDINDNKYKYIKLNTGTTVNTNRASSYIYDSLDDLFNNFDDGEKVVEAEIIIKR